MDLNNYLILDLSIHIDNKIKILKNIPFGIIDLIAENIIKDGELIML